MAMDEQPKRIETMIMKMMVVRLRNVDLLLYGPRSWRWYRDENCAGRYFFEDEWHPKNWRYIEKNDLLCLVAKMGVELAREQASAVNC